MAVHQNHRGKGIGHLMMNRVLDICRLRNVQTLELYSHTSLSSAIHLYHKFGFKAIPMPADCVYDRANTRMELAL
jgi:GNAT superfamily N-acetyltransferase